MSGPPPPPVTPSPPPLLKRLGAAVRRLYLDEWEIWKSQYRRYFKIAARLLGIGFVLGFVFFTIRPDQERQAMTAVLKALEDIPLDASPPVLALILFYHNARASLFAAAAGWIPFLCLPAFDPLLNGTVLGLLVSIARHQGVNVPALVMTGIIPHGIFELPAILYVTSVGISVSVTLGKKILGPRHPVDFFRLEENGEAGKSPGRDAGTLPGVAGLAMMAARSFVLVVLPLLFVAAVIEAFVTPLLTGI